MAKETKPIEQDEIHNEDFQFVLKELLNAYEPILEEDLKRAKAPEKLKKEAEAKPPSCDDELALANRIFEKFFTEKVAVRLLEYSSARSYDLGEETICRTFHYAEVISAESPPENAVREFKLI